jgi:hypothetical protein
MTTEENEAIAIIARKRLANLRLWSPSRQLLRDGVADRPERRSSGQPAHDVMQGVPHPPLRIFPKRPLEFTLSLFNVVPPLPLDLPTLGVPVVVEMIGIQAEIAALNAQLLVRQVVWMPRAGGGHRITAEPSPRL